MRARIYIYIISIVILLSSTFMAYAQQWHTTLDVRRPAAKQLPAAVNDLLVVNNAVSQPDNFGHAVVSYGVNRGSESIDLKEVPQLMLFAVTERLDYSGMFSSVGLVSKSQNAGSFFSDVSLNSRQADSLAGMYMADALLVLDKVVIYDKHELLRDDYDYYAVLEAYTTSTWTLLTKQGGGWRSAVIIHADTLVWEESSYDSSLALQQLPDRHTALLDMATYSAERFAAQYIPQWETVDRYLYQNRNDLLAEGMTHFTYRRWQQAAETWQAAYEAAKDGDETKAYAAADIAVAEEIQGDLQSARQWAKRSAEAFGRMKSADAAQQQVNVTYYMRELEQRERDEKKLNQ